MQKRSLTVLGTAAQVPTAARNHVGCFVHWDRHGFLFDPGEGTQRQLLHAGIKASEITKIFITHFHGDHCLGLPGVIQRLSLQRVAHPVEIFFPASGRRFYQSLLGCAAFYKAVELIERPVDTPGLQEGEEGLTIEAQPLDHGTEAWGYRIKEPDSRTILPQKLPAGISGERIGELKQKGWIETEHGPLTLEEVSRPKPGQAFALAMDTRMCPQAVELARDADLFVCESTYLSSETEQATSYRHLTAAQAANIAVQAGAKKLVLLHYSQRYRRTSDFQTEAEAIHSDVSAAMDGDVFSFSKPRRAL